jgi:uncharacterized membrane protein
MHAIQELLALLTPCAFAVVVTILVRRKVAKPFRFMGVAGFALIALQVVILFFFAGLLPPGEPDAAYVQVAWLTAAFTAVWGCPLLWLIYRGMRHVPAPIQGA